MVTTRKTKKAEAPIVEASVEEQEVQADTPAKAAYRALIERYKEQNPEKYATKKAEFDRKLSGDISMEVNTQSKRTTFKFSNTPEA